MKKQALFCIIILSILMGCSVLQKSQTQIPIPRDKDIFHQPPIYYDGIKHDFEECPELDNQLAIPEFYDGIFPKEVLPYPPHQRNYLKRFSNITLF